LLTGSAIIAAAVAMLAAAVAIKSAALAIVGSWQPLAYLTGGCTIAAGNL
jgi:hypothetical protein